MEKRAQYVSQVKSGMEINVNTLPFHIVSITTQMIHLYVIFVNNLIMDLIVEIYVLEKIKHGMVKKVHVNVLMDIQVIQNVFRFHQQMNAVEKGIK